MKKYIPYILIGLLLACFLGIVVTLMMSDFQLFAIFTVLEIALFILSYAAIKALKKKDENTEEN